MDPRNDPGCRGDTSDREGIVEMAKHQRKSISSKLRFSVYRRDRFRCVYCGATGRQAQLQLDHCIPVAAGGDNSYWNLLTACAACNNGKQAGEARFDIPTYQEELRRKNIAEVVEKQLRPHFLGSDDWKDPAYHPMDDMVQEAFRDPGGMEKFLAEFRSIKDPYEGPFETWFRQFVRFMVWVTCQYLKEREEFFGRAQMGPTLAASWERFKQQLDAGEN